MVNSIEGFKGRLSRNIRKLNYKNDKKLAESTVVKGRILFRSHGRSYPIPVGVAIWSSGCDLPVYGTFVTIYNKAGLKETKNSKYVME